MLHDYGTDAFLLQYKYCVAICGPPLIIYSDIGSQLISTRNYIIWTEAEAPSNWIGDKIRKMGQGMEQFGSLCLWDANSGME